MFWNNLVFKYETEEDEKLANAMERKPLLGHKVKSFFESVFDAKRLRRILADHSETIPIAIGIMTAYSAITWSSLNDDYRKTNGIIGCVLFSVFTLCRIVYTFVYWIGIPVLRPIVFYLGWISMLLTTSWTLVILWIDTFEQKK